MWQTKGFISLCSSVIDDVGEVTEKPHRRSSSLKWEGMAGAFSLTISVIKYAECKVVNISERGIRLGAWKLTIHEL
jgi:hypothetical protein